MRISSTVAVAVVAVAAMLFALSRSGNEADGDANSTQTGAEASSASLDSISSLRAAVRKRISESNTYLGHALAEDDSVLRRWEDRTVRMLTVHIGSNGTGSEHTGLDASARRAFSRWERVGAIPVAFRTVRDSANAEVHVHWIRSFPVNRSGQAEVFWDENGWIRKAPLTLATRDLHGRVVPASMLYTVDPSDLMYPVTTVSDLTGRDRRSARLLYALPAGSVRDP